RLGTARVALCGDVVAAHAGALPDPDGGVVVVAGTGAVAFGAVPVKIPDRDGRPAGAGMLAGAGEPLGGGRSAAGATTGEPFGGGRAAAGATTGEPFGGGRAAAGATTGGPRPAGRPGSGAVGPGGHGPGGVGVGGAGPGGGAWSFDSAVACVDGWGHLLGDAGSGFWIGRRGLDAALRAHDGRRGGSPVLARLVERDIGPLDRLPE